MVRHVEIMDTTLRDGEQTSGMSFTSSEKLAIAKLLIEELKIDRIEVASARVSKGEFEAVRKITGWAKEKKFLNKIEILTFLDNNISLEWLIRSGARVQNLLTKGSLNHLTHQIKQSPKDYFNSVIKKRSICFILSDFMTKEFEKPLKIASKKHDLVALRIHDTREDTLPNVGLVPMQDAETEKMIFVDSSSKRVRDNFAKNKAQATEKLRKLLPASGVDLIDITTGTDYVKPLINFFKTRGSRR